MKILAFEFSSSRRSVAAWDSASEKSALRTQSDGDHTQVFALVDAVLSDIGWNKDQPELLAIGLGPGSYTGIRLGVAAAQGWQLARGVSVCGVSSMEALAWAVQQEKSFGAVHLLVDAHRQEVYHAAYDVMPDSVKVSQALNLMGLERCREELKTDALICGPDVTKWFDQGRVVFPTALEVAKLALHAQEVPGEQLEPITHRETEFLKVSQQKKAARPGNF